MESIWYRPLTRKFWIPVGVILSAGLLAVSIGPVAVADVEWFQHRSFVYRGGEKIDLPFGWIYDSSALPVTFAKKTFAGINGGIDSTIYFDKIAQTNEPPSAYLKRWDVIHEREGFSAQTSISVKEDPRHRTLLCSQQEEPKLPWLTVHCVVDDASWMFMYSGSQGDLDAAKAIMTSAVSHDGH